MQQMMDVLTVFIRDIGQADMPHHIVGWSYDRPSHNLVFSV